jgi:SAM-dependent methyltransferase
MKRCLSCAHPFDGETWTCPECGSMPAKREGHLLFAPGLADENDGMAGSSHAALDEYQDHNFWFRARNRLIVHLARKHFPQAANIMEVGCGTGYVLGALREAFPGSRLAGSEIYSVALGAAQARAGVGTQLFQMDAREIPFLEEFDLICAFDVLEHISEDTDALQQMYRATKPGGGVVLSVPQHPFLWSPIDEFSHHKRRYRRNELEEKCEGVGFSVLQSTSFVSALLPLMAVRRLSQRKREDFDPAAELKLSGTLNRVLERVLDAERKLVEMGASLPAGGSRFVVARKA